MSTLEAALIVVAVLIVSLAGAYEWVDRARHRESTRDRLIREAHEATVHDVGPDSLRLLQDLDAYVAADAQLAAGFDRLRQAIRDEQNGDPS